MTLSTAPRAQSPAEELANSLSHGLAALLSAAALVVMGGTQPLSVWRSGQHLAEAGFVLSLLLLYGASALCHALPSGPAKQWLDRLDRAAICVFIAASYSPFAVPALRDPGAWAAFAAIWLLALAGAWLALRAVPVHPLRSTLLYLALGWLVLLAALPWIGDLRPQGRWLLLAGGLAYSLGALLFLASARWRYAHLGWHLMVMLGSGLHAGAVWVQSR
jgi:hemolysin III